MGMPIKIGDRVTFLRRRKEVTALVTGIRCMNDDETFLFVGELNEPLGGFFGPVPLENLVRHEPRS